MIHCGTLDDVYSYEKMKHDRKGDESPYSSRLSSNKTGSFRKSASPQLPTVPAKLGGKRSSPFRWISQQSDRSSSKAIAMQDMKERSVSSVSPPKKTKEPSKRVGFVDILLGYHSLLQVSPGYSVSRQRKELYPTIGFIQDPDHESQNQ